MIEPLTKLDIEMTRLGLVIAPDGDPREVEGVLNPAGARARNGALMLYPRAVAKGNISRLERVRVRTRRTRIFDRARRLRTRTASRV